MKADRVKGIFTLPVLLGDSLARRVGVILLLLQYPLSPMLTGCFNFVRYIIVIYHWGVSPYLLVLAGIPNLVRTVKVYLKPAPPSPPLGYPNDHWPLWFVYYGMVVLIVNNFLNKFCYKAFRHTTTFGSLFLLGTLIDFIVSKA